MRLSHALALVVLILTASVTVYAQEEADKREEYIRSNYAKFEYKIPMRDGARLFTAAYIPNDRSKTYPILMVRTPYNVGPYGADKYKTRLGPTEEFETEGYIFVFQDVRGRYMSEGEFINMRPHDPDKRSAKDVDESTDTYDTIEWLLANIDNHNGRVGQWGISYPGFFTSAGMIDSHPALKAVSPQAPIADWFWDDMYHHGAFILSEGVTFFSTFGKKREAPTTEGEEGLEHGTPDSYQFFLDIGPLSNVNEKYFEGEIAFWNEMTEHPNYDEFWQSRNILPHLRNIKAAVMVVGGWYDAEDLYGTFKTYRAVEKNNPGIESTVVIGPWAHGGWSRSDGKTLGDAFFGFNTADYYRDHIILQFFNHYLKDGDDHGLPEAFMFETGANRWRSFDVWPPDNLEMKKLYMSSNGSISFDKPPENGDARDDYISDPAKPVPFTKEIGAFWPRNYMTEDQRYTARRPDVLVYKTGILKEDITLAGPLTANLFVATTGSDSDWIVKLIDVFPDEVTKGQTSPGTPNLDAYQLMIRSEIFRGRFRESYENPKPFKPGEVTPVSFELQDVLHTFKRGHRIMIQIHSTWFPLVDRNPQKYVPNIFKAKEKDFITVTNSVYRSKEYPSHIEVGVLE